MPTKGMDSIGSMKDEALKRKERLKALKQKQTNKPDDKDSQETEKAESEIEKLPKPVFRSYKPSDDSLKESQRPQIKPIDVTEKVQSQLEASKVKEVVEEVDLVNLAPRKPDWDLKRDVAKKLEKLEKRTQRAIAELIRERLKASKEDFANVVNAGEAMSRADTSDDED